MEQAKTNDLAEFFRREGAPRYEAAGALTVAEELLKRGMKDAAAVAIEVAGKAIDRARDEIVQEPSLAEQREMGVRS